MASVVQGEEASIGTATFDGQLGATPTSEHDEVLAALFHREPEPGVAYANIAELSRRPGQADVLVAPAHDNYGYSLLQPRRGAGRGVVLAELLPSGVAVVYEYDGDYALQPRPGAGRGEVVLLDLIPHGAGVVNNNYTWQPGPGLALGELLIGLQLPDGVDPVHSDYGYYAWQPSPGFGRDEVFIAPLPDGGAAFDSSGNFPQQTTLPGAGHDGSAAPAGDLGGAVYDNPDVVAEHLRCLVGFVGIGASSMAVNGLTAGPGAPAAAFHLFALLLVGLFLVDVV